MQRRREVDCRLSAELNDDAIRLFLVDDVEHVFRRQRLEIEAVGNIEVRRDRLRVVVDDDRLNAHLAKRPNGMHGAIVKLDALPDADRARAEHDDLARIRWAHLVLLCVECRVVVRCRCLKFRSARVDHLVARQDVHRLAECANLVRRPFCELRDRAVGKADVLRREHELRRQCLFRQAIFHIDDMLDLVEEPLVDLGYIVNRIDRCNAAAQCLSDGKNALVVDA